MASEAAVALKAHNIVRKELSLPPLQWSPDLASQAEFWAKELIKMGELQHSDAGGENLFWASGDTNFTAAVESWLNERSAYHGERIGEGDPGHWGHFSQCVWSSTTQVGMGKASDESGTFVVARYAPKGNVTGQKPFGD
ncbi:MAG: hypothetical protein M1822_007519 [Bathelium mastoideum]|nr:MAG: hypothetical protein M1822_007519 [Bathelium mastoideum]